MVYDDLENISTHFDPIWRGQMWGIWGSDERGKDPDGEPFEIPMQGLGAFCDAVTRDDIRAFVRKQSLPSAARALDQTIERIDDCIALKTEQASALHAWLSQQ